MPLFRSTYSYALLENTGLALSVGYSKAEDYLLLPEPKKFTLIGIILEKIVKTYIHMTGQWFVL